MPKREESLVFTVVSCAVVSTNSPDEYPFVLLSRSLHSYLPASNLFFCGMLKHNLGCADVRPSQVHFDYSWISKWGHPNESLHESAAAFCESWGKAMFILDFFFFQGGLCVRQAVSHIMDRSTSYSPEPKASPLRKVRGSGCWSQNRLGQLSISVGLAAEKEGRGWCESHAKCFG